MSGLKTILAALPSLKPNELATVKAAIERLVPTDDAPTGLYKLLTTALGVTVPYNKFKTTKAGKAWPAAEKQFLAFIDETWPNATRTEHQALCQQTLLLIREHLKRYHKTPTMTTMVYYLSNAPYVFDAAFPGYREGNLAFLFNRAMVKK